METKNSAQSGSHHDFDRTESDVVHGQQVTPLKAVHYYCFFGCQHVEPAAWYPRLPWDVLVQRASALGKDGPLSGQIVDEQHRVIAQRLILQLGWDKRCAFCLGEDDDAE